MTQSSEQISFSGWCTSRHPETGSPDLIGRFSAGPLGCDVAHWLAAKPLNLLAARHHDMWEQLTELANRLEQEQRVPVEFEFTLVNNRAWPIRVRKARMKPLAYVSAMHGLARTGVISPDEAVLATTPQQVQACLGPTVLPNRCWPSRFRARRLTRCWVRSGHLQIRRRSPGRRQR